MYGEIDYNNIPVVFCANAACCSLAIKIDTDEDGNESDYCNDCGCLKTEKASIEKWEEYYIMAHGEKFLKIPRNANSNSK